MKALIKSDPKPYSSSEIISESKPIEPTKSLQSPQYINPGDLFSGFSKSLSKKSEYFFSELEIQLNECDFNSGIIS